MNSHWGLLLPSGLGAYLAVALLCPIGTCGVPSLRQGKRGRAWKDVLLPSDLGEGSKSINPWEGASTAQPVFNSSPSFTPDALASGCGQDCRGAACPTPSLDLFENNLGDSSGVRSACCIAGCGGAHLQSPHSGILKIGAGRTQGQGQKECL